MPENAITPNLQSSSRDNLAQYIAGDNWLANMEKHVDLKQKAPGVSPSAFIWLT